VRSDVGSIPPTVGRAIGGGGRKRREDLWRSRAIHSYVAAEKIGPSRRGGVFPFGRPHRPSLVSPNAGKGVPWTDESFGATSGLRP